MPALGIGDVSQVTGTNPSTLRLWEQHGLINPARSASGQRIYGAKDIAAIRTIHRLRKVDGLNMSAIKSALASSRSKPDTLPAGTNETLEGARQMGLQFRVARQRQGLSLRKAAELTGLPVSFISTFERTGQGATVTSLQRLAASYKTSITKLTNASHARGKSSPYIVRKNAARRAPHFAPGITVFQLAETLDSLDCQQWVLQPGAGSDGAYSHEGEEFIYIMQGILAIAIDGGAMNQLSAGDSISFNSQLAHSWRAIGDEPTVLLWVNTPKSF